MAKHSGDAESKTMESPDDSHRRLARQMIALGELLLQALANNDTPRVIALNNEIQKINEMIQSSHTDDSEDP
jgi:hypothetical protein